jgi:hypothetical protein
MLRDFDKAKEFSDVVKVDRKPFSRFSYRTLELEDSKDARSLLFVHAAHR